MGGRVFPLAHSLTEIRKRGVTTGRQKTLLDTRRHERDEQTASDHYSSPDLSESHDGESEDRDSTTSSSYGNIQPIRIIPSLGSDHGSSPDVLKTSSVKSNKKTLSSRRVSQGSYLSLFPPSTLPSYVQSYAKSYARSTLYLGESMMKHSKLSPILDSSSRQRRTRTGEASTPTLLHVTLVRDEATPLLAEIEPGRERSASRASTAHTDELHGYGSVLICAQQP